MIVVNISEQNLYLLQNDNIVFKSEVSTAINGVGCQMDSNKTPNGLHIISSMIGHDKPIGTLFNSRLATNKIIREVPNDNKDYITSRIIRLSGLEYGYNKGGDVDSFNRYIYIHGTPHKDKIGTPQSHGCIRMTDIDVIQLYDLVKIKMLVMII